MPMHRSLVVNATAIIQSERFQAFTAREVGRTHLQAAPTAGDAAAVLVHPAPDKMPSPQ